jgi:cysteine-rich repeat protein
MSTFFRFAFLGSFAFLTACGGGNGASSDDAGLAPTPDAGPACSAGTVSCDDSGFSIKICSDDNENFTLVPCGDGKYCSVGSCHAQICAAGEMGCQGRTTQLCNEFGSGFVGGRGTNCEAADMWCRGGECVRERCEPNCNNTQYCSDEGECRQRICEPDQRTCNDAEARLCDSIGATFAETTDCAESDRLCHDGVCINAGCGNGILEDDEICDDANFINTDACTNDCRPAACGDGVTRTDIEEGQPGYEACDDNNNIDTDACSSLCTIAACGDGFLRHGVEECDDANQNDGDACTNRCMPARCGDGSLQVGEEQCDDGNRIDDDDCTNACQLPNCRDGIQQDGEQCDDGDELDNNACTNTCMSARCGDSIRRVDLESGQAGFEICDDGNRVGGDGCGADCTHFDLLGAACANAAACGLGHCLTDGVPAGYCSFSCIADIDCGPGALCRSLNGENRCGLACARHNQCRQDDGYICHDLGVCWLPVCGNGQVEGAEDCDDANLRQTDDCLNNCTDAFCGDGHIQDDVEACDDGDRDNENACSNMCETNAPNGSNAENASLSCRHLKTAYPNSPDGTYWIRPSDQAPAFRVHCDMTSNGGGWTRIGYMNTVNTRETWRMGAYQPDDCLIGGLCKLSDSQINQIIAVGDRDFDVGDRLRLLAPNCNRNQRYFWRGEAQWSYMGTASAWFAPRATQGAQYCASSRHPAMGGVGYYSSDPEPGPCSSESLNEVFWGRTADNRVGGWHCDPPFDWSVR